MQRNIQEYIENRVDHFERTFEFDSLARLKKLAEEKGLAVKGRSKAVYINALVDQFRRGLEAQESIS